ncbi:hypothetical protein PR048_013635 [Dryococelus australis]|uniref:Uncharacterized protein n=1 Tax=Dryococelus australis TaxID=614101 RepID=A0ABQ9HT17_9NEOP|nr:hypothetical protein PR048_013635 [Dryococelus australis]
MQRIQGVIERSPRASIWRLGGEIDVPQSTVATFNTCGFVNTHNCRYCNLVNNWLSVAWQDIQKEFIPRIPKPELKKKKASLMAAYTCLRKNLVESEITGEGHDDVYKPSWFAYNMLR